MASAGSADVLSDPRTWSLVVGGISLAIVWTCETPSNLWEARKKIVMPLDTAMPKPVALIILPLGFASPLVAWWFRTLTGSKDPSTGPLQCELIGLVGFLLSGVLVFNLRRAIGRFYTFDHSIKYEHKVAKTGPYAFVRHPGYTSVAMLSVSMLIFTGGSWWCAYPCLTTAKLMMDTPKEEKMLSDELGKEYDDFCKTRRRFIPFLF